MELCSVIKGKIMHVAISIPSLEADGTTATGAQEKAELINQQFTSAFTHEIATSTLPDLGASPYFTIVADNIMV